MADAEDRWTLPDWERARQWCEERNTQQIRCILDILTGAARSLGEAEQSRDAYISCIGAIKEASIHASVTVKLTALGAVIDPARCRENVLSILRGAWASGVDFEIDMEGKDLVDYTLGVAQTARHADRPITLALQAYLDRTPADLERVLENGVRVRLVKGAYAGDTHDFGEIQMRFRSLFSALQNAEVPFSVGTHDPDLIRWMLQRSMKKQRNIELGFLKGLSDRTKLDLAHRGWNVAEYVPFGVHSAAYIFRRERYENMLRDLARTPAL